MKRRANAVGWPASAWGWPCVEVVLVLALLSACAAPPAPPDQFFRLTLAPPAPAGPPPPLRGVLVVEQPEADGLLAARAIVHSGGVPDSPLMEYTYFLWEKAPGQLIRDVLVDCLSAARVADTVVADTVSVRADHALTGRVERLERIEGNPPRAILALRLGVVDNRTGELRFLRRYAAERAASGPDMATTIAAFNDAVSDACGRLVTDIARL